MEALIITLGIILIIVGYVSCVLPPFPGPPIAFLSLLLLHFSINKVSFSWTFLIIVGVISILSTVLDNIVAVWGTHKFGGTKAGVRGSFIGMFFGVFLLTPFVGLFSVILGPVVGAVTGELIAGQSFNRALQSGFGSFLGFIIGLGLKFIIVSYITYSFIKALF